MGMIGIQRGGDPTPEKQRQSFLKLVYENGYLDGYHAGEPLREQAYLKDEEALTSYRRGLRIGKQERLKTVA